MTIIRDLQRLEVGGKPLAVTIGNFDGVHLGHRRLLEKVLSPEYQTALITFRPHPQKFLNKAPLKELYSEIEMSLILKPLGLDYLIFQKFDKNFSKINPEDFFYKWLIKKISPAKVVLGFNFRFGHGGLGSIGLFKKMCEDNNIELNIIEPVYCFDDIVSSSRVRRLLQDGDIETANKLLGQNYFYTGKVIHGQNLGRSLEAPTANLSVSRDIPLSYGVYMTKVQVDREEIDAITNVGVSPTLRKKSLVQIESHLLDRKIDLYGKEIVVKFLKFLRPEKKFKNSEELKLQIGKDIDQVRHFLTQK